MSCQQRNVTKTPLFEFRIPKFLMNMKCTKKCQPHQLHILLILSKIKMLSNLLMRIPYKTMLESGDCTNIRFSPDFFKEFNKEPGLPSENGEDDKLHPINRFFAVLDPEMWELSDSPCSCSDAASTTFPTHFLICLFDHLSPKDLKRARLVCKHWNTLVCNSSPWTENMVAILSGPPPSSSLLSTSTFNESVGVSCTNYLTSSKVRFRFWSHLRLRNIQSRDLAPILTTYASTFARAVKRILTLELISCSLTWDDVLELLYLFRGLSHLEVKHTHFSSYAPGISSKFLSAIGLVGSPSYEDLVADLNERCPPEDYFYSNIKYLAIYEDDLQDKVLTPLLLTLLKDRTNQIDEFVLVLGQSTVELREVEDQNCLWQSVHNFLGQKNVCKCRIESSSAISSGMVNRFFMFLSSWKLQSQYWRMEELQIHLRPLILWGSFERHLVPLVQRFSLLKLFSLQHIVSRGKWAYPGLRELMKTTPPGCRLDVGLIIDDQGGLEAANLEKELLSSLNYRQHLVSIDCVVVTDATRELRDMIPYKKNTIFANTRLFSVTTNGRPRPRFFTFNLNVVIHNFPNLTELSLVDGPPPKKLGSLFSPCLGIDIIWKDMSGAVVCDDDMQLILKNLVGLTKLVIRANMKYITDSGFTGFSMQYCKRLTNLPSVEILEKYNAVEHVYRDGVSFANLPNLRHLSIEGIGPSVTDVTVYLAFRGINGSTLKFLNFFGAHQISKAGKVYLVKELSDCEIILN